jgi:hypothetical protein
MRSTILTLMAILALPMAVQAQVECGDDDTLDECLGKNMVAARGGASTEDVAKQAAVRTTPDVTALINQLVANALQPGAQGGSNGVATSTITDLIPWFDLLGVVSDSDASDGTLVLDYNFRLPVGNASTGNNSQLKWVFNVKPEPNDALVASFDESVRAERKAAFADRLDDSADSELSFSWSLVTDRMGRDFRHNHAKLNALYAPTVFNVLMSRPDDALRLEFLREIREFLGNPAIDLGADPGEVKLGDPRVAPLRARLEHLLETRGTALGKGQLEVAKSLRTQIAGTRLSSLSTLVLMQPQLLFSATRRFRDELVGPESYGAKITYEQSFASFGDFMQRNAALCSEAALTRAGEPVDLDGARPCYTALDAYLTEHAADIENQDRFSVSLEYRKVDAISYSFPDDGVTLDVPKIDRLVGSVGYGRVLAAGAKDRVDFRADYDSNVSGGANGRSRFVVTATYTRDLLGMSIPFSLVYANKSEFLDGVDEQISLHVGVKFKAAAPAQ